LVKSALTYGCTAACDADRGFHTAAMDHSECQAVSPCGILSAQEALVSLWQWALETPQTPRSESGSEVRLHVYDVSWMTSLLGMPVFHIGVEVWEREFSFGQYGIQCSRPGCYDPPRHKQAIVLGRTSLSKSQFRRLMLEFLEIWQDTDYKVMGNNCQTFAVHFCQQLGLATHLIPKECRAFAVFDWSLCGSTADPLPQSRRPKSPSIVSL